MRCSFCDGDGGQHVGPHLRTAPGLISASYTDHRLPLSILATPMGLWVQTESVALHSANQVAALNELLGLAWQQVEHLRNQPADAVDVLRNAPIGEVKPARGAR